VTFVRWLPYALYVSRRRTQEERASRAAEERRKAAEEIARESERIERRIAEETKRRAEAEVARRVAEATQEKLRAEESRRQAAGMMSLPKEERRRKAESAALRQQEKKSVASAGAQFDAEQSWRGEQEAAGRRLFATAHGRDGLDAGGGAGLLGLPPGYSIIGPPVPLEERRADMKARSQALLDKLGAHQFCGDQFCGQLCGDLMKNDHSPRQARDRRKVTLTKEMRFCSCCRCTWDASETFHDNREASRRVPSRAARRQKARWHARRGTRPRFVHARLDQAR
jgi:flagellar biosynthesis GTPase FlhF